MGNFFWFCKKKTQTNKSCAVIAEKTNILSSFIWGEGVHKWLYSYSASTLLGIALWFSSGGGVHVFASHSTANVILIKFSLKRPTVETRICHRYTRRIA